jgi:ABC-type transport system involved in multi-copper enzyme maturation permease subunit
LFLPPPSGAAVAAAVVPVLSSTGPLEALALTSVSARVLGRVESNPAVARREGIETVSGRMTLLFGAFSIPLGRERADAVRFVELALAWGVAGTAGLLLALVWTAGFVPSFLEPSAASVLLSKPISRRQMLLGKYLGVVAFVGVHMTLFVAATWLALGVRTGVWELTYWWCVPLLLVQFAVFYSFSVLLAVATRSTVACVFGSILFWLVAWGINYGSVMAHNVPEPDSLAPGVVACADAAYWVTPKPVDGGLMLFNALQAEQHFDKPIVFRVLESRPSFSVQLSILSSLLITALLLAMSAYEFNALDY